MPSAVYAVNVFQEGIGDSESAVNLDLGDGG